MKEALYNLAKTCGADLMGVAPAARFAPDHKIFRIYPQVKSVIGFVFRCLRGSYRGTEEGTTYYQYAPRTTSTRRCPWRTWRRP